MRVVSLLLLLLGFIQINWPLCACGQWDSRERNNKSTLRPAVERVFLRKKRWMVFPKGSNLKFTLSLSKRLLALYPKGCNFAIEAGIYYPMPAARMDLIPKRFRKPTTKAPTAKGPTPLYLVGIPGSLIKYRAKPAKVQRIDQNVTSLHWPASPSNSQKWSKYSSPEYLKNYQWSPEKQQKYVNKFSKYNNNWFLNSKKPPQMYPAALYRRNERRSYIRDSDQFHKEILPSDDNNMKYEPIYFEELEPFEDSPHYHSYRSRRELFHHFEGLSKILGIDMKSCILRAVCDSKRFLLPPGYSMVQDILRVVFTFPTINGLNDDYSRIMESDYQTCDAYIRNKCPLSILDWLLKSENSI